MTNSNLEIVKKLQNKVDQLVDRYRGVKEENKRLKEDHDRLTERLEESARKFVDLENQYNTLKFSKTIEASVDDVHDAKIKINQIVREIDKCIALLNR